MMRDTIVRFSIPFREAMSALLAGEQIDADSYEIRVLNGCVVVDLINPVAGSPLPVRHSDPEVEGDAPAQEDVAETGPEDEPAMPDDQPSPEKDEAMVDSSGSPSDELAAEDSNEEPFYRSKDEEPKAPENDEEASQRGSKGQDGAKKPRQGANAQRAGILCTEGRFQVFMDEEGNEDGCAKAVRQTCGVTSRRELDTDPKAKREWERLLSEYEEWCRT